MDDIQAREWAISQFGTAKLGDLRNQKRLLKIAATVVRSGGGTISKVMTDPREREAAYDFVENERISAEAVGHAAAVAAARQIAREPFVWLAVDGSSSSLPDSRKTKGMGRLGSGHKQGTGIKVITCLAVDPQGVPVGPGEFRWWVRSGKPNKQGDAKRRVPNAKRSIQTKETRFWLNTIRTTRSTFQLEAPMSKRWWIMDREADSRILMQEAAQHGEWFTIRSKTNRRLIRKQSGGFARLRDALAAQPIAYKFLLSVPGAEKRKERQAQMHVTVAPVTLELRDNWSKKCYPMSVNAVWVREVGTTPAGEAALDWVLYTNHPVEHEDLPLVVYSSTQRWRIEEFHRTWKRAACRVEDNRLER